MKIYFIRHGEPDYSFLNKNDNCQWANLSPLSEIGIEQAKKLREIKILEQFPIISSPYTRALQTATILANGKDIIVEPKLHEWLPSKNFDIKVKNIPEINKCFKRRTQNMNYELKDEMIERMNFVLDKYKNLDTVIIVAHSRLICTYLQSIGIEKRFLDYCEIVEIEI